MEMSAIEKFYPQKVEREREKRREREREKRQAWRRQRTFVSSARSL